MIDGVCFTITDAIKGSTPSYDSPKELAMIVKELAKFHKASAGFRVLEDTKPKEHLGTWIEDYTKMLEDMSEVYKMKFNPAERPQLVRPLLQSYLTFLKEGKK